MRLRAIVEAHKHSKSDVHIGIMNELSKDSYDKRHLYIASKLLAIKEMNQKSVHSITYDYLLAANGIKSHLHVAANVLCKFLKNDSIEIFLNSSLMQRGLFVSFVLNNILFRCISKDNKTSSLSETDKKKMFNLIDFCVEIKKAFNLMGYNKAKRLYGTEKPDELSQQADWAIAQTVIGAYKQLRTASLEKKYYSKTASYPKTKPNLIEILNGVSVMNKAFQTTSCEKADS